MFRFRGIRLFRHLEFFLDAFDYESHEIAAKFQ